MVKASVISYLRRVSLVRVIVAWALAADLGQNWPGAQMIGEGHDGRRALYLRVPGAGR